MNFIKLTSANGEKYRINFDYVESYGTITDKSYDCNSECIGLTFVLCNGMTENGSTYIVKETPKQIDDLIKPRKVKEQNGN